MMSSLNEESAVINKTLFILVRHGQTEWNRVERFRGRVDVPLNDIGISQAQATGKRVAAEWQPTTVYSSPLSRAVKTAEAIASHFNLSVHTHPDLADIDYGEWHGLTPAEVRQCWPKIAADWYGAPQAADIPGGENLNDLRTRAAAILYELAEKHPNETIVLVGHTVINRMILLFVLGLGNERFWKLRQDTCAINVFESSGNDHILVSLNDTCHLKEVGY